MEYVPRVEYVNVIVNDDYRGIYILSENITRDKDCRIDVDKDEGYHRAECLYAFHSSSCATNRTQDILLYTSSTIYGVLECPQR